MDLGSTTANKVFTITIAGETSTLTTDSDGKVEVTGCQEGTLQARSTVVNLVKNDQKMPKIHSLYF